MAEIFCISICRYGADSATVPEHMIAPECIGTSAIVQSKIGLMPVCAGFLQAG